jgi:hypothetical protein
MVFASWDSPGELGPTTRDGSSHRIELIGSQLLASAEIAVPGLQRLTDYFALLQGVCRVSDLVVMTHRGKPARNHVSAARIRLDDIAVIGESRQCGCSSERSAETMRALFVRKWPHRLVVMTPDHLIYGDIHLAQNGSLTAFIDAEHPRFVPMTNVRVRWLADRRLAGRFNFALLHRSHVMGFELQPDGEATVDSFEIPGAAFPVHQPWS